MHSSIWIASLLAASAYAAPSFPAANGVNPTDLSIVSDYFNLLASKVSKVVAEAPICDLSKASMPAAAGTPLPPPGAGFTLKHVAIGRGTQNYTCSPDNSTAVPVAIGAIATLYNASCMASTSPDVLAMLPNLTLQWDLTSPNQQKLYPASLLISGHHYFSGLTTPTFNLDTDVMDLGFADCAKNASTPAPANAAKGQGNKGYGAVAWLKLLTKKGATGNLQEVYRLNTAGGNPPATCAGMPATFEVQYAAEYWFWQS